MLLALVRHGIAEDAGPATGHRDEPRRLTPQGASRMARAAEGVARLGVAPAVVLTSPLTRCAETAAILGDRLGAPVRAVDALRPGARLEGVLDRAAEYPDAACIMACGHMPDLAFMVADLIGGGVVEFRKGTLALVDLHRPRPGGGVLVGLHRPAALRRLAGG
jgi:phosphohistidine phosphatase